jgi:mannose-6-phosphate isomerase-like protein (cupin superfamily)
MKRPFGEVTDYVVHRTEEAHWVVSHSKSRYQKRTPEEDPIHVDDPTERRRLGHLGFQPFYTAILNSSLPSGLTEHAMMEIHQPSWVDSHYGEEFIYCLRGEVTITVNGHPCELKEGDAMCFEAKHPHQYQPTHPLEKDDQPALILIVVTKKPQRSSK